MIIKIPWVGLCPRCRKADFKKTPKEEWKNPLYPIYKCGQCGYYEERFG